MYETNYNTKNGRMQKDIIRWSSQVPDFSSRTEIMETNFLPRLLYFFSSLSVRIIFYRMGQADIPVNLCRRKTKCKK